MAQCNLTFKTNVAKAIFAPIGYISFGGGKGTAFSLAGECVEFCREGDVYHARMKGLQVGYGDLQSPDDVAPASEEELLSLAALHMLPQEIGFNIGHELFSDVYVKEFSMSLLVAGKEIYFKAGNLNVVTF